LLTIPFTVTIPPAEIDRDLPAKLMAEAEVSLRGPSPALYVGIATGYRGRMS
jgi:hypothetical protein